jgi:hypothetical protein
MHLRKISCATVHRRRTVFNPRIPQCHKSSLTRAAAQRLAPTGLIIAPRLPPGNSRPRNLLAIFGSSFETTVLSSFHVTRLLTEAQGCIEEVRRNR